MILPLSPNDFASPQRFEKRRLLGVGGMGAVYEVFDRLRQQRVALKTILRIDDAAALYRFKQEFRALAHVVHPNLVRLDELIAVGDQWCFTMELVEGDNFLGYVCPEGQPDAADLDRGVPTEGDAAAEVDLSVGTPTAGDAADPHGCRPPAVVLDDTRFYEVTTRTYPDLPTEPVSVTRSGGIPTRPHEPELEATQAIGSKPAAPPYLGRLRAALRQLAEGLTALHSLGKLHRDIKPSNVLVTRQGRVVLLDFGLAADLAMLRDEQNTDDQIVGTITYMSPEQAAGQPLSPASDWYSVGVMLYRALTGRLPFQGSPIDVLRIKALADPVPPIAVATGVPDDLNALCVDLLRLLPENRPLGPEVLARLSGTAVAPAPAPAPALAGPPPGRRLFVGRGPHLAALHEALGEVRSGRMVAAFVRGRSGAGKSALVQRFLDEIPGREAVVILAGRCYEQESVAYKALDSVVDSLSHYLRRLGRLEAERLLPRDIAALARVFPVLGRVAAVAEAPGRDREIPDPQELRRRAFAALRELLARIGDRKLLVVSIDDLQWGDLDSAALLAELSRPPDPPALLLIGCYRSEYEAISPCLRILLAPGEDFAGVERRTIAVEALRHEECRDLVRFLIGQDDPTVQPLAELIVKESGGSPYFVYELVQYLIRGGELTESLATAGAFSLDEVLWRRILRLPQEARLLMETLAVAGRPLRQADACRAAGLKAEGFAALTLLRAEHLVRGMGAGALDDVETFHDRIRETVLNHLDPRVAKARHYGLVEVLEATERADPEALAVHFEAAGVLTKAGRYFAAAAAEAAQTLAFDRAAKLYRRALELAPGDDGADRGLRLSLADALANAGRGAEAAQEYLGAAAGAGRAEVLSLKQRAGYQLLVSGHVDRGLEILDAVLESMGLRLPSSPVQALVRLRISRALLRIRGLGFRERDVGQIPPEELDRVDIVRTIAMGLTVVDWIRGSSFQAQSLLLALRAGEPLRVALALAWETIPSACEGWPARRRTARLIAAAEALARRIGDPRAVGMAALAKGAAEFLEGRFLAGTEITDRAFAILRENCTGVTWEVDTAQLFGLWSLIYAGRIAELHRRTPRMAQEARERGDLYMESTVEVYPAAITRVAADQLDEARARGADAIGRWSQQGFHVQHLTHFFGSSYINLYAGDAAAAWRRVQEVEPVLRASQLLRIQLVKIDVLEHCGRAAVAVAASSRDPQPSLRAAEGYARRLDGERLPWARALAQLIRAGAAAVRGDPPRAVALLTGAVAAFDAVDMGLFAAAARWRLGGLLGGDAGRDLIAQADKWMAGQEIRNPARMAACIAPGFASEKE